MFCDVLRITVLIMPEKVSSNAMGPLGTTAATSWANDHCWSQHTSEAQPHENKPLTLPSLRLLQVSYY